MEKRPPITTEIHFAQLLASNQKNVRDKALKKVGRWLASKSRNEGAFTESGMLQLWKGIYYYFWNLDKPLIQENLAAVISKYIHDFQRKQYAFMYIDTFFQTMAREWSFIDRFRIEKFMMFVRKFLREVFAFLKHHKWTLNVVKKFRKIVKKNVASIDQVACPFGLKIHIIDIYMEELARVGADELTPKMVRAFLLPYCNMLAYCEDVTLLKSVQKEIFLYLVTQDADCEVFGEFPQLKFELAAIITLLKKWHDKDGVKKSNQVMITKTIEKMKKLSENQYDLAGEKEMISKIAAAKINKKTINKAARSLQAVEKQLMEDSVVLLKKKKKS